MRWIIALMAVMSMMLSAQAQFITFTGAGTQTVNFNSLASSPTNTSLTWTNGTTANGVYAFHATPLSSPAAVTSYMASIGDSATGSIYSFGSASSTDRALGAAPSITTGPMVYGVVIRNTSATALRVSLAYTGEQWRVDGDLAQQKLEFSYKTFASAPTAVADWAPDVVTPSGYTDLNTLDFVGPKAGLIPGTLDGNAAANRIVFASTQVTTVAPGQYVSFRWYDYEDVLGDHGLAIDDLSISASPVPEPATVLAVSAAALGIFVGIRRRRA